MKFICKNCGKEFEAKLSSKRKYCCKKCSDEARKGVPNPKLSKQVEVTCAYCVKKKWFHHVEQKITYAVVQNV